MNATTEGLCAPGEHLADAHGVCRYCWHPICPTCEGRGETYTGLMVRGPGIQRPYAEGEECQDCTNGVTEVAE